MAKKRHQPNLLPAGPGVRHVSTAPIIEKAKDIRELPVIYANHAQFSVNPNEIFIDLYRLEPEPGEAGNIQAFLLQRVVIPLGLAKGFATGLANIVAGVEKALGIVVPLNREPDPEDTIKIWDQE
jgi:hypothetical protein